MLNISQDYQLERLRRRLEIPEKNWKFNPGDLDERALWGDYMQAFETAMGQCSSEQSPWYVVPAENRRYRDVVIASLVLKTLKEMEPNYPEPNYDTDAFAVNSIS